MAITHQASTGIITSATAQGSTSMAVAYPAAVAAGRMAVLIGAVKLSTATWNALAGWTLVVQATGGTGASAADAGTTRVGVWIRTLDGSESGSVTVTNTGGESCAGAMSIYSSGTGYWSVILPINSAADTTHGTNPTAVGTTWTAALAVDDLVVWGWSNDTDANKISSLPTITQTSATFGAVTHRNQTLSTTGNDSGMNSWDAPVTAGNANAPTVGFTSGISQCGAFGLIALREGTFPMLSQARWM